MRLLNRPPALAALLVAALMSAVILASDPAALAGTVAEDVVAPSVVVMEEDGSYGSGTVLALGGRVYVLTAGHCVEGSRVTRDGRDYWAPVHIDYRHKTATGHVTLRARVHVVALSSGDEEDLALLETEKDLGIAPARLLPEGMPEVGEEAHYCGAGAGVRWNLQRGIISVLDHPEGGKSWLGVTGDGWFGHSGSAVYVTRGKERFVVGVVSRVYRNGKAPVLCVGLERIRKFVEPYSKETK